jgi:hypothetical protein
MLGEGWEAGIDKLYVDQPEVVSVHSCMRAAPLEQRSHGISSRSCGTPSKVGSLL